jgi:hypothetical protein
MIAAFLLVGLALFVIYAIHSQIEHFTMSQDPVLQRLKLKLQVLDPRFEEIEMYAAGQTYTINKRRVYVCVKDADGRYYDDATLTYAILHELAHVQCTTYDLTDNHGPEFHSTFDKLLKEAERRGLYDPTQAKAINYCGYA